MLLVRALLFLFAGLVVLILGAEYLVRGASRVAVRAKIPPLVIGLTIVAFGTSSPELAISVRSAMLGNGDIGVGNVIGSNIFNILFILGLSAAIRPIRISRQLIRFDAPLMILVSLLLFVLSWDLRIGRFDANLLFAGILVYISTLLIMSKRRRKKADQSLYGSSEQMPPSGNWMMDLLFVSGGMACLLLGAEWVLRGAVDIAMGAGINELIIGLTIVAIGTSLPEIATSVVASFHGKGDISVGNIVGSNIFNILAVLGIAGMTAPHGLRVSQDALTLHIPVMIAAAAACLPIFFTRYSVSRWEGFLLLFCYCTYTAILVLETLKSPWLEPVQRTALYGLLPAAAVVLLWGTAAGLLSRGRRAAGAGDPSKTV